MATAHNNIPDLEVFGKGSGDFKLPCGYVDDSGRVFNHVYLREMSGVEDDIMGDEELNVSERMTRIIANCVEKLTTSSPGGASAITDRTLIDAAVGDNLAAGLPFTIPDRMACLLYIRRLSLGDRYPVDGRRCPACGQPLSGKSINLADLKINFCKDPTKRNVRTTLPKSQQQAILRVLTASGERRVAEARPDNKNAKSYSILARLVSVGGKELTGDDDADLRMVQSLPRLDRLHLLNVINLMEGSIETEVETKCKKCQADFKFDLDLGQVLFSNPEETQLKAENLDWV